MRTIVRGKTEGEHRAEMQKLAALGKLPRFRRATGLKGLPKKHLQEAKRALQELEETKGDFSKDH